jgi:chemotaxis protein MotB
MGMKKVIWALVMIGIFIMGMVVSEPLMDAVNNLFKKEVFLTRNSLENQLAKCRQRYGELEAVLKKKQAGLGQFLKEIQTKDYFNLAKESLLAGSSKADGSMGKIILRPPSSEMLFKPTGSDDQSVREVKEGINEKISTILDVSRGILREKVAGLNLELLNMNAKLKENNHELNDKLAEVEAYKRELDRQKSYIGELEGIRTDLKNIVTDLETKIENGRLKVSFKGDILFDSGRTKLKTSGIKLLESVLPVFMKSTQNNDLFIVGHTDNVPIKQEYRNKYDSNWDLSTYRAIEVVKYLTSKGLRPENLTAAGYGEYKPIADNATHTGRSKNRRVELYVIPRIIKRQQSDQ